MIYKLVIAAFLFSNLFPNAALAQNLVVAKINNKIITEAEVIDRYRFVIAMSGMTIKSDADQKLLRNQVVDKMIDEEFAYTCYIAMRVVNLRNERFYD